MKKFFLTILMIIMIIPIGTRALNASVDIGGQTTASGGGTNVGGTGTCGLGNSYGLRISLIKTENNSFDTISTVYYIASENYLAGKPDGYGGDVYVSKFQNGTKTRELKPENVFNYPRLYVPLDTFWVDTYMGNVKAKAVGEYFNPNTNSGMEHISNLLAKLKIGSKVWNNSGYDRGGAEVKTVFDYPNLGCDKNDCNLDKLRELNKYTIIIEPVYRFNCSPYVFTTSKGYPLYWKLHQTGGTLGCWGEGFSIANNVYSTFNGANPANICNITFDVLARPDNGYGMGTIKLSDVVGDIPSCDNNTQCCYKKSGNDYVSLPNGGGTHYKVGENQYHECCDKSTKCCYESPSDDGYRRDFTGNVPLDDNSKPIYKKVNGKFKECSACKAKKQEATCRNGLATISDNSKLGACTFDDEAKSGIKLATSGDEVTAACRDEIKVNLPGNFTDNAITAGRYFVLENSKDLLPNLTITRYCYAKKNSSTNSIFANSVLTSSKLPKVTFSYVNDTNSKNDIGGFTFNKDVKKTTTYEDLGNDYNNYGSWVSGVSSVANGNYVLRKEVINVTYKSSSWVKALTGKVTYVEPSDKDKNSYYKSKKDNSIYISYKTPSKSGGYEYMLKFDFSNYDNKYLKQEINDSYLFNGSRNSYVCKYKVKQKLVKDKKLNFFYRTVDLDNINHKNRKLGPNWSATKGTSKSDCLSKNKTKESKKSCLVQLDMKNKENSYKELTEQGDSYRFRLTPIDMKTIRKYNAQQNKNSDGFNDFNLEEYSYGNYKYDFYISRFLTCIYGKECKNLGSTLNNYLSNKEKNFNIDNIRNNLVKKLNNLEMDTGGIS